MPREHIISGIDIGNSQIKVVMAKVDRSSQKPEIIGAGSAVSEGLRKGTVVDMDETVHNLRGAIDAAEVMAGTPMKRAWLAVNGLHIRTQISKGVVAVSRADGEISQSDIDRVLQAASVVSMPANREIIHVIPRTYIIDGTEYVKNPLGMKGVRLEAEVMIIDGLSPYLRNIAKCANEAGVEVAGLVYAPLAAASAALDKRQKEHGVVNLDFGGGTSTLTIFEESDLLHTVVLPVGSRHITNDIAVAMRTSMDVAEQVKLEFGSTSEAQDMRKKDLIDLPDEGQVFSKKNLVKVIDARVHELMDMVNVELKKVSRSGILPGGIVLCGGGSHLPGVALLVKDRMRLPVRIAEPAGFEGNSSAAGDPSFSVAVGLVMWGLEEEMGGQRGKSPMGGSMTSGGMGKVVSWLKGFLP